MTNTRRTTAGPDLIGDIRALAQRVSDLELARAADLVNATSSSTIPDHSITDTKMVANTLTGASMSTGLALPGALSTAYGFVNNSTGMFVTTTSQFSFNSTFTDPDSGVSRDAKFGQKGIAVGGGTKTDTLNVTGASTMSNSGLTITSIATFATSAITLSQPTTFSGAVTFNSASLTFTGRPIVSSAIALDSVTGAAGAGLGNIAAQTVQDYNIKDASVSYTKLTGTAQSQITALTTQDSPWSALRRVTATGSSLDANGHETDGLTVLNSATRVTDAQAYAGYAISNTGMTSSTLNASGGPGITSLQPGQYRATFYVRVISGSAGINMMICKVSGTNVGAASPVTVTTDMAGGGYLGFVVPFTVTASGSVVNCFLQNQCLPASATWNFSHVYIEPITGIVTASTVDNFFASASITSAKISTLIADKIVAGTINSDNIFLGSGGHIYAGTTTMSPTGNAARIELNAGGLYGYDGTQNTFSLTNTGLTLTGTVNATGGTLGSLTVTGTLTGGTISGTTITGGTITGTVTNSATINGGTIVGALIETTATSTASRTVLDNSHGLYVNIEATTNYVTNPSAEYFTNPGAVTTNWTWGSGNSVNSMAYDVVNGGTVLPMPPGHYMVAMGGSTADTVATPINAGDTTFQSNSSITVGQYVSFGTDPAIKITASAAASAVNYTINNPGFETGSFANWTTAYQTTGGGATYSIATGQAHTGTYAASIATTVAANGGAIATDAYPIQAGDTVYATAWVKRSVASSSGFYLKVSWGNTSTFTYGGTGWLSESNWVANGATTTSYAQYGGTGFVAPAGATYFRIEVVNWASSAAGTMYVDDLAVTVKATTTYTLASAVPNAYAVNSPLQYGEGEVRITMANLAASTTYTAQFNANASSATYFDALQGYVLEAAGAGRKYAMTYSSRFTPLPASTWSNFSWTFTTPADWAGPATLVLSTPRTATGALTAGTAAFGYLDNLQVEPKGYPTDYADGDYGSGYSWAGTAGTTASNRANMRIVDFPHTLGQPTIRNVMTTDGLNFPLSNSVLIPDQLGGIGGLDLNGRGVQTTMATVQSTSTGSSYTGVVTNSGMVSSNNLSFRKGRLYRIMYQNLGITVQTYSSFYSFSCLIGSTTLPNVVPGDTLVAGNRGMSGAYHWYYAPTSDVLAASVTILLNGGLSGATTVTHGYDYLEITDMGIQR